MTAFFRWLTHTHAMRWRVSHRSVGYGRLYRGRFKSFPVQRDEHFLTLCRYVERNPLAGGLEKQAHDWPWSSLTARKHGPEELRAILAPWRPRQELPENRSMDEDSLRLGIMS